MRIMVALKEHWTAKRIKDLRDRRGETQAEFGRHFLLGGETVRKWEKGQKPSGPAVLVLDALERYTNGEPALLIIAEPQPV